MAALADIIAAEAEVVATFVGLLKEEQDILQSGNADALPAIVERKTATVLKLSPITAARNAELARAGIATNRTGIETWASGLAPDDVVRSCWLKLQALAEEARELNRVNGQLIQLRMQTNTQALETLLAAANRQDLYGADGQAATGATRRIIDSA